MGVKYLYGIDVTGQSTFSTNVGIGTLSPSNKLSVFSSGTEVANFYNSTYFAELYIQSNATNVITLGGGTGDSMSFETGGSERLRITSAGNVGIGTTAPTAKLSVVAASTGSSSAILVD